MSIRKVSVKYADSLVDVSFEKKIIDKIATDVRFVLKTFDDNQELLRIMENPILKPDKKLAIFNEIFVNHLSEDFQRFVQFIFDKKREEIIYSILKTFLERKNVKMGIARVEVFTSVEFSVEQKKLFESQLEKILNKKLELEFHLDDKIIGGFVAKVDDLVIDASLKHQLDLLKKQFLQGGVNLN